MEERPLSIKNTPQAAVPLGVPASPTIAAMGCGDGSSSTCAFSSSSVCRNASLSLFCCRLLAVFSQRCPSWGRGLGRVWAGLWQRLPQHGLRPQGRAVLPCRGPVLRGTAGETLGLLPHAQLARAGLPRGSHLFLAHRSPEEPGKALLAQLSFQRLQGPTPQSGRLPTLARDTAVAPGGHGTAGTGTATLRPSRFPLPCSPTGHALVHLPKLNPLKHLWLLRLLSPGGFKHYFLSSKNIMQVKSVHVIISAPNVMMTSAAFKSNNVWAFTIEVPRWSWLNLIKAVYSISYFEVSIA